MNNSLQLKERIAFILVILLLIIFIGLYIFTNQSNVSSLTEENHLLELENNRLHMEFDVMNTSGSFDSSESSYYKWLDLDEKAEALVKDSNGQIEKSWAMYLVNESDNFGIDLHIAYELLKLETGGTFDPSLIGPKTKYGHAYGLGQFMKNTAPWIADMSNVAYDDELLFDPYYSIHLTFAYLDFLYDQYDNWNETLTAYHRGIAGLEKYIEKNGHAKSEYATDIMNAVKKK